MGKTCFQWRPCKKRHHWLFLAIMWKEWSIFVLLTLVENPRLFQWAKSKTIMTSPQETVRTLTCNPLALWDYIQGAVHVLCTITFKYLCLLVKRGVRTDQRPLNLEWGTLSRSPPDAPLDTSVNWRLETWLLTFLSGHLVWHIQPETKTPMNLCKTGPIELISFMITLF